jgi:uncharacterized paraquat-inducible protein A
MGADTNDVVEELTRPVIKLLLALIGLFILRFIVNNLPGLGTRIPGTGVTATAALAAVITLAMVGILVNFGIEIEPRLQRALSGPSEVITDLSEIVKFLVFLVAIIVAYDGLAGVAVPFLLPDLVWVYDVVFLLVALVPTALVAQRMFTNLDELTDLLTQQVKSATVQEVDCPDCGETVRSSLDYCPSCGTEIPTPEPEATDIGPEMCPDCGSDVAPSADFCGSCGTAVGAD